ncbi:MAG TPA: hypothetical protein DCQ06_12130 [Myxococcales bacterium]|nr:hypothetical protein [Myxococcales bacterium]HAN32334.1 hypothetical protein [Myxococcales bacterium]
MIYDIRREQSATIPDGVRAQRRLQTLAKVNDAALRLISQRSVDGWTMADLARDVGLTPGAFYRYFQSKEEIIATVQITVLRDLMSAWRWSEQRVLEHSQASHMTPVARLLVAAAVYQRLSVESPHRFALLTMSITSPTDVLSDEALAPVSEATLALLTRFTWIMTDARRSGHFHGEQGDESVDHDRAAQWVFAQQGLLQLHRLNQRIPGLADISRALRSLQDDLLCAWGVRTEVLAEARKLIESAPDELAQEPVSVAQS